MSGDQAADETGDEDEVAKHPFDVNCGAAQTTYTVSGYAI